jgi:hypothetical protein
VPCEDLPVARKIHPAPHGGRKVLVMVRSLSKVGRRGAHAPLALAESGWVWVGAASWLAGLQTGRTGFCPLKRLAQEVVCAGCGPAGPKKTCQGREGSALPVPFCLR